MVHTIQDHPGIILRWISYLVIANGLTALSFWLLGKLDLFERYFFVPTVLASALIGQRLHDLKAQEEERRS
ncbi:hypothetical protein I6A84_27655 [Frankia sp. CNm7]|uniref:Uncharacterized protein n=1 Tax=Frankia nepalensis TaxID=1836974 RepID=A0A937RQG5_9ACTN|nr:hypothetical protein [Frankia nepalensis]MBL7500626.1 hypothetical protein [Frankia nepalensis]MBL7511413.1 hypothetical protein [Frankia nepalensis]MBL7521754.1 hypothetical protein [Frankia nepalensis]MBL7631509.1 hypothetical protein [Frankia nepalensis]